MRSIEEESYVLFILLVIGGYSYFYVHLRGMEYLP